MARARARLLPRGTCSQDTIQIATTVVERRSQECSRTNTDRGRASIGGTRTRVSPILRQRPTPRSSKGGPRSEPEPEPPHVGVPRLDPALGAAHAHAHAHAPALAQQQQVPPREQDEHDVDDAAEAEEGDHDGGDGKRRGGRLLPGGTERPPARDGQREDENRVADWVPDHRERLVRNGGRERGVEEGVQYNADPPPVLRVHLNVPPHAEEEERVEEDRAERGGPEPEVFPRYSFGVEPGAADPAPVGGWTLEGGNE